MDVEFDPEKRLLTLEQRGLDFLDVARIMRGPTLTYPDVRQDYGEER